MDGIKKMLAILLLAALVFGGNFPIRAASPNLPGVTLERVLADTGACLLKTVPQPGVGPVGGEWAVIGLARSACAAPPDWYPTYYRSLEEEVVKKQGLLHDNKYSEYSRAILALAATGKDPANVGGYNLLERLGDLDSVLKQGINGPIFALLALDAGNYTIPQVTGVKRQTTREQLLAAIAGLQLSDGGFSLGGGKTGDPDITALALQALAPYQKNAAFKAVIDKALANLAACQNSDGGYISYWHVTNVESDVQVLVALTALGIDPTADARFIKNGNTVVDHLLRYYVPGGGFKHMLEQAGPDNMATEQAFYGLVAYDRFLKGKNNLYDMTDVPGSAPEQKPGRAGLPGKNIAVTPPPVRNPGKTFADIKGEKAQAAIEALASHGIINGTGNTSFEPGRTITRAEFAAIVVQALGLPTAGDTAFTDVPKKSWYAAAVAAACEFGIVRGTSETTFSPGTAITREQAAVMAARAAELCGMHTVLADAEIRDTLAQFPDYTACATWAREALAFCYQQNILAPDVLQCKPQEAVTRAEVAGMIHQVLQKAALL